MPRTAIQPTAAEQLARLQRRSAASENIETLQRILGDAQELGWIARESLDVGSFIDRVRRKIERLTPSKDATKPKRHAAQVKVADRSGAMSPAIQMVIGPWETDERGVLGRKLWNGGDQPPP
jgi:hypothetical protein